MELESLERDDFKRILVEPENALTKQYAALLATEGITLEFTESGIEELADIAYRVNEQAENIGARRLHTIMEKLLADISFEAPDLPEKRVVVDRDFVRQRLADVMGDADLARYIL